MFSLKKLKLMTRLSIGTVVALMLIAMIMGTSMTSTRKLIFEDREVKTRHLVEAAYGVVAQFQAREKEGLVSRDELQKQALAAVKAMRYDEKEYFWIHDLSTPMPKMVMHPTLPALEGKALDDPRFNKATSKRLGGSTEAVPLDQENLFVAFNETVAAAGHGFVTYLWPKPMAGGGVTQALYTKLSYVKKFEPWAWVIGSGIYIDDVEALYFQHARRNLILAVLAGVVLLAVNWIVRRSIVQEVGGEPRVAVKLAGQIAQGDLTGEIAVSPGDRSSILFVLKQMQDGLKTMLNALGSNAQRVEKSIEQLSAESNQVSLAAQLQATSVGQTRGAADLVSQRVETVTVLATDTEQNSRKVAERARHGAQVADCMAVEMTRIATTVEASSAEVSHLVASTREVEQMANVIRDIAEQTNMLALNAAIEAARAGEHGRGFAVVADEVRKLAERTSHATQAIGTLLKGIQADTQRAVSGMNAAAPVIAAGVDQANQAAVTLREIELQAQDALAYMRRLTDATREQTAGIEEIVTNINAVTAASAQTEEVAHRSISTAAALEEAAAAMFEMVKRFRINASDAIGKTASSAPTIKPLIEWSAALAIGHHHIDQQHQKLIEIANRLSAAMHKGQGRDVLGPLLKELVDYTVNHFGFEEGLMDKHGYPYREQHLNEHRKLIAEVQRFVGQFESGKALPVELMGFVRDWLVNHILKVDKALARELSKADRVGT